MNDLQKKQAQLDYIDRRLAGAAVPGNELNSVIEEFYCKSRQRILFEIQELKSDEKIKGAGYSARILEALS